VPRAELLPGGGPWCRSGRTPRAAVPRLRRPSPRRPPLRPEKSPAQESSESRPAAVPQSASPLACSLLGPELLTSRYPTIARRGLFFQGAEVGGYIDGIGPEDLQRDDLKRALMGRGEHHGRGGAVAVACSQLAAVTHTPVPRHQAREPELGHGRGEVVAYAALMLEELVVTTAQIVWLPRSSGRWCSSRPVETSQRIGPTWLKLAAEHITVAHIQKYPYRGRWSASSRARWPLGQGGTVA